MDLRIATCRPLPEVDVDEELLLAELSRHGLSARMAAWNDPAESWDEALPTLLRSTWDYIHDLAGFRAWLARAERAGPLWNPRRVVETNLHKSYLFELERRGVPIVPTHFVARGSGASFASLLRDHAWEDVVVKPAVGAGSFATRRFRAGESAAGEAFLAGQMCTRDMLVQPYLESMDEYGERALVWIDGVFTHAVRKTPRFSGEEERVSESLEIDAAERALGSAALAPQAHEILYARVDVAHGPDGGLCVMELELIEPSLFLKQNPRALTSLAAAIARRLDAAKLS